MLYEDLRQKLFQCRQKFGGEQVALILKNWNIPHLMPNYDMDKQINDNEFEDISVKNEELMSEIVDADPDGRIYLRNVRRDDSTPPVSRDFWKMPAYLTRNPWLPPSPALPWLLDSLLKDEPGKAPLSVATAVTDVTVQTQAPSPERSPDPEVAERERGCLARLAAQRPALADAVDGAVNFARLVKDLYGLRGRLTVRELGFISDLLRRAYGETYFAPTARQGQWLIKIAHRMLNGAQA